MMAVTRRWMDPNGDGSDYLAIARLTASFVGDPHHTEFYIAYDLLLNQADNPGTVAPIGDINEDAFVGIDDLTALLTDWNKSTIPTVIPGDFNEDGFVGIEDLNVVLGNWNAGTPPTAVVPEPAALSLLLASGLALGVRRR